MWNFEDIEELNPPEIEAGQKVSFLSHVVNTGAVTKDLLCEFAEVMEQREGPYVAIFCQLPFGLEKFSQTVSGTNKTIHLDLSVEPKRAYINGFGQLNVCDERPTDNLNDTFYISQCSAILPLWGKRARLHEKYEGCISPAGFTNRPIGQIKNWMRVPEAFMEEPKRRHPPLLAQAFQAEVARRLRDEMVAGIDNFLNAYGLANLVELPRPEKLYNYFIMISPGRIACADVLVPVTSGICAHQSQSVFKNSYPEKVPGFLNKNSYRQHRVVSQLMSMHRLLEEGEPELSLIGAISALEWYLNEKFPEMIKLRPDGSENRASINQFLKERKIDYLSQSEKQRLKEFTLIRNELVHGSPPSRDSKHRAKERTFIVDSEQVRTCLFSMMEIFRKTNLSLQ